MIYTTYKTATGQITGEWEASDVQRVVAELPGDESILWEERVDGAAFYLPGGVKTPRPVLNIDPTYEIDADGQDEVAFDLPSGSRVFCLEPWIEWLDEDEFAVTSNEVGSTRYKIEPTFPFQSPIWVTINAA